MATSPPAPPATIYSVAEAAGVSIATVSRVLQGSGTVSRQHGVEGARGRRRPPTTCRSAPPAAWPSATTRRTASSCPSSTGPYYSELLVGFEARAAELGQSVSSLPEARRDPPRRCGPSPAGSRASRCTGPPPPRRCSLRDCTVKPLRRHRRRAPAGSRRSPPRTPPAPEHLTAHLLAHGRRRLVFLGAPTRCPDSVTAMPVSSRPSSPGLDPASEPVRVPFERSRGRRRRRALSSPATYEADAARLRERRARPGDHGPSAQAAVREIPGDLAVVGWDDVMAARYVRPGLTTVRQPVHELGEIAATRLQSASPARPPWTRSFAHGPRPAGPLRVPRSLLRPRPLVPDGRGRQRPSTGNERKMPDAT